MPPFAPAGQRRFMEWISLVIVILNAVVSVLTNLDVNRKRAQSRVDD